MLGHTTPRLWTPPLRPLTPDTSYGFDVVEFARDRLYFPLDPWQQWQAIHAGELLPDGRPRFRIVLVLVARQNGKTTLPVILSLYWQFIEAVPLILGTSTKLDYAKESWQKAVKLAEKAPDLAELLPRPRWHRDANGEQESWVSILDEDGKPTGDNSRYKIAASNAEGGRSLTIHRLILDELRQHHDYSAYDASEPTTTAVWDAQIWALSNAGDDNSVVLNDLRESALEFIETGEGDYRLGLFEWSAPEGADPRDLEALAMANPNLGRRIDPEALLAKAERAIKKGGLALTGFQTENMCIRVKKMDPALDPAGWRDCAIAGNLNGARSRIAACIDVAPDELHATLYAAAVMPNDRTRVDFVQAWEGAECTKQLRRDLPGILRRIQPQTLGWFPNGPAAAITADLAKRKTRTGWPPAGVTVTDIKAELPSVCMGFAEQVKARAIEHGDDPLLNAQAGPAERLKRGDMWVFSRKGEGHVDAVYAAAGAAHLARTLPPPPPRPGIIVGRIPRAA